MKKKEITLMLTITDQCNLKCVYCYETNKRNNSVMNIDTAKKIICEYLQNDNYSFVYISLFGGEPFMQSKLVVDICEWTWMNEWKVPYIYNFSTNGTMLGEEIKRWLKINKDRIIVNLSADGIKETQNFNRTNSFDLIDYQFFIDTWQKPYVKMTISNYSIDKLADNVIFFHEKGFLFMECNFAEGIDWKINKSTLKKEFDKLLDYYEKHPEVQVCPLLNFNFSLLYQKESIKRCGIGDTVIMYYIDGERFPCNCASPMSMDIKQIKKIKEVNFNDYSELDDKECMDVCKYYNLCPTCYAENLIHNNEVWKRDRNLCEILRLRIYYAALIKSRKIIDTSHLSNISDEEKIIMRQEINAIKDILTRESI